MKTLLPLALLLSITCLLSTFSQAQCSHDAHPTTVAQNLAFVQNDGQWEPPVLYKTGLGNLNALFLEKNAFTYVFHHPDQTHGLHEAIYQEPQKQKEILIDGHAYKVHFLGANVPNISGLQKRPYPHSYFIGNDPAKWASDVGVFNKILYDNLYNGINLEAYSEGDAFKYDFIISPGSDVSQIQLQYEGVDDMTIKKGALILTTSVETIHELEPYAWQMIDGQKQMVECQYHLSNNIITFRFPKGYDETLPLIIDPVVVASTLSGTTGFKNFGHSATFDNGGNIYTAGISFGPGYPATTGAFQSDYGGGGTDICLSKYNPDGSLLLYATYVGGSNFDYPHSTVVDFSGQLCVYGSSSSSNFPTTSNAYQTSHGGDYDIIVTKLNADGTQLVGSTFMGGSQSDGHNNAGHRMNYGDIFRGEIIVDAQSNIYVTSNTQSFGFPVTANAFDGTYNNTDGQSSFIPAQDAVVFKLNSDLSTLFWSTFIGGDGADTGAGLRLDDNNNVYVTGTAGGSNFPNTGTGYQSDFLGGYEDAYVLLLSADGHEVIHSTFFGTTENEHSYFMDIDEENNVHIYGQTTGNIPPTPNTYSTNNNSPQFLAAFNSSLSELVYKTNIGTGSFSGGDFQYVPVAFMVDKCDNIYFSGYYAVAGLPTTPDAIIANGNDMFYLGVLDPLATGLSFGTYYGNANHVDGGTSRFDKSGTVYQGVCSCTWSGAVLNTLPNAWDTGNSLDCDVGVFKIDFEVETVTASAFAWPSTSGCLPFDVNFTFTGQDATQFYWEFGDGASSSQQNPSHTYTDAGTFTVMVVGSSEITCNQSDTFYIQIDVLDGTSTLQDTSICQGNSTIYLDATTTNASYEWQDGSTGATQAVTTPGTYWVEVDIGNCSRIDSFIVHPTTALEMELGPDFSVCDQNSFTIQAGPVDDAVAYQWNTGVTGLNLEVVQSGSYWLEATDEFGCVVYDTLDVLFGTTPDVDLAEYDTLCHDETVTLDASSNDVTYLWQDGSTGPTYTVMETGTYSVTLDNNGCQNSDATTINYFEVPGYVSNPSNVVCTDECNGSIVIEIPSTETPLDFIWNTGSVESALFDLCEGDYSVTITDVNGCTFVENYTILNPLPMSFMLEPNPVTCYGDGDGSIEIIGLTGGFPPYEIYFNGDTLSESELPITNLSGGEYDIAISDSGGCTNYDATSVYEPPYVHVFAGDDRRVELGDTVHVNGFVHPLQDQLLEWVPLDQFIGCLDCPTPEVQPIETTLYILTATDSLTGCIRTDSLNIFVDKIRKIYIPNAFSPNFDGTNDVFMIYSGPGIQQINKFKIFDRWGELVFEDYNFQPNDPLHGWDGIFLDQEMNNAVFVYTAEIEFIDGVQILYSGDVTLLK